MKYKVGIIGAGFTGLAAAYRLAKAGIDVEVFEKQDSPGGLATGFKDATWNWSLEQHYHHFFVSDTTIQKLAVEIGHSVNFYSPVTSTYYEGNVYQLDTPASLLKFTPLNLINRLRTGAVLAGLKLYPWWQHLEGMTAKNFIVFTMGSQAWKVLWKPLFEGKFGKFSSQISASWFWARIHPRSARLGYPNGGFLSLAKSLEAASIKYGANFNYGSNVTNIDSSSEKCLLEVDGKQYKFDKVICTLPTGQLEKISKLTYPKFPGLGAINLVIALKQSFLIDGTYWLNINDRSFPFLAVVEHTNFISTDHYGGDHLIYVGNYLPADHRYFEYSNDQLLTEFFPYLSKLNPKFSKSWVRKSWIFKAPFAQPVVEKFYSKNIPSTTTDIPNLYLANIQQVYPWDRGTNFAVVLGNQIVDKIIFERSGKLNLV